MEQFIKRQHVNIVFFTNENFKDLNSKIREQSKILGEENFLFIDSDIDYELISRLNIKSVPIFNIYKNGKLIEEIYGTYNNIGDIIRLHF